MERGQEQDTAIGKKGNSTHSYKILQNLTKKNITEYQK